MRVVEGGVVGGGALAVLATLVDGAQLAPQGDAEVDRGPDPLRGQRQAVAGRVAGEEDAALGRGAQLVRDPVPLVADPVLAQVLGQQLGRLAHVEARVEGADADPQLVAGRERPAVAGGDVAAVDPDLEVLAAAVRVHLEPARERRVGRLEAVAGGEHAAPAERVDDERRREHAAVGLDRDRAVPVGGRGAAVHLRRLEARVALLPEQSAELAVVEGGEGPGQLVALAAVRGVDQQRVEALALGGHQPGGPQPVGRDAAGRGLALADLVAVDDQHRGAAARQLTRDREPGEAGAADQHVVGAGERNALVPAFGRPGRHDAERTYVPLFAAVSVTDTTITPAANGSPVEGSAGLLLEVDGKVVPNYAATMVSFDEGDVVKGKVVRIDKDEVLVDIGYKSEGVIPSTELSIRKSVDPADEVELGEEIDALVLTKEDSEGRLVLSKKRARFEKAWRKIEAAAESGEPVEGNVIEVVKGGLILDLGVRGFLPASLVDIRRVHNLDEFLGQALECKVIELNRSRNNVVLSRRAVLEEERKEVREQILGRLEPGQVVEGKISNIVDFGAFVDLDGIDGLIHISELSWSHVNHPSEVVSIGDTVRIKVLDIDRDRQRISLGLKQTQEDPWQRVISTHRQGDVLEGTVTKVVAFGAFVEILPGVEGLVHISELADHHVESPSEVVEPNSTLNVKILEIDEERRRLSLSIKRVEGQNMPMGDLGQQIEAAGDAQEEAQDDASQAAGPVGAGDPPPPPVAEASSGEVPPTPPPAAEAVEADAVEPEAVAEEPAAEAPAEEAGEPEAVAEEPVAEETAEQVEEPEAAAEESDASES